MDQVSAVILAGTCCEVRKPVELWENIGRALHLPWVEMGRTREDPPE